MRESGHLEGAPESYTQPVENSSGGARACSFDLSEQELDEMAPGLRFILEQSREIVHLWYRLYALHFGDRRCLSESHFTHIFEPAFERTKAALLNRNLREYARHLMSLGRLLAGYRMPLEEAITALHLFDQCVFTALEQRGPWAGKFPGAKFEKLSYLRIRVLVDAYLSSGSAAAGERIAALEREAELLPAAARSRFAGLVGASAPMRLLYSNIEASAAADRLLVVGECGTGHQLVAHAVHESGPRAGGPFVAVNCAALPPELLEDELFGYSRDPAQHGGEEYLGMLRSAQGGTLFVDEVTEAGSATQLRLARLLSEPGSGAGDDRSGHGHGVQLIVATSREPHQAVQRGHLHKELLERLHAPMLQLPPLRERREDLPLLIEHFTAASNRRLGRQVAGFAREAMAAMAEYSWPGNVQELREVVEDAVAFCRHPVIELEDLPEAIARRRADSAAAEAARPPVTTFAEAERTLIKRALESTGGNKVHAANLLRISRKKLYAKIQKYGL